MSLRETIEGAIALPTWPLMEKLGYKMPRSHYAWRLIGGIGAVAIAAAREEHDHSTRLNITTWQAWAKEHWPLYCISTSLLRDFEQTDISGLEKLIPDDWEPPLPGFLLALPENAVRSPEGHAVLYLMVVLSHPNFKSAIRPQNPRQLSVLFIDAGEVTWSSAFGIGAGSQKIFYDANGSEEEEAFLESIRAIALQAVLSLEYLTELVEDDDGLAPQSRQHRAQKTKSNQSARRPRWLGRTHKRAFAPRHGEHSSPALHWRRGHWRQQAYGLGRRSHRLVWIRPTLVNANAES